MGIQLSTPNFIPRQDQLLFPNEILYNIINNLTHRDIHWGQQVCRSWYTFANTPTTTTHKNSTRTFLGDAFGIVCYGSEARLHLLVEAHRQRNHEYGDGDDDGETDPLPLGIAAFFLEDVELTRQPLSLGFWSLYSEVITRLEFTDCAVLPRICVAGTDEFGNVVNVDTNFTLGCPNLKKLALRKMDKSFMMGGQYLQFHQILCLSNLISLDVSLNKNITDRILLNLLLKTEKLESLNLKGCPLVLARAVHNRFYPRANFDEATSEPMEFSDHIFSFETIVRQFLVRDKGTHMRELILKATPLTSYTLELIQDPAIFTWESLDLSYCRELKTDVLISVLSAHSRSLKKFSLKSDGRGVRVMDLLKQVQLRNLEYLSIRNGIMDRDAFSVLGTMPKLKKLSCSNPARPVVVQDLDGSLMQIQQQVFSTLKNITQLSLVNSNEFVNNGLMHVVIQTMKHVRKLNLSGCDGLSDFGLTGVVTPPKEQLLEETDPNIVSNVPPWLLCHTRFIPRPSPELESVLEKLIEDGKFPKILDQGLFLSRRNWTGCLSDLKYLEELDLSSCRNLSSATWHFALRLPYLYRLNLSHSSKLSLNSLGVICQHCPNIEYLNIVQETSKSFALVESFSRSSLKRLREFKL